MEYEIEDNKIKIFKTEETVYTKQQIEDRLSTLNADKESIQNKIDELDNQIDYFNDLLNKFA